MADIDTQIVTQPDGESFRVAHRGELGHRGDVVVATPPDRPLVHMLMWDSDCACSVNGRLTIAGDPDAPIRAEVRHAFHDTHHQSHVVKTALAEPIHHALQLRTPLQVRFCNTWHIASDYTLEVNLGRRQWLSLRLTGATIAKPQPCDEPCPPVVDQPVHP